MDTLAIKAPTIEPGDATANGAVTPAPSQEHIDIDLLLRQLAELEARANEADKPWYRDAKAFITDRRQCLCYRCRRRYPDQAGTQSQR